MKDTSDHKRINRKIAQTNHDINLAKQQLSIVKEKGQIGKEIKIKDEIRELEGILKTLKWVIGKHSG